MGPDPYHDLAELLRGTTSLMDYYAYRMKDTPQSLESAKAALQTAIRDLEAHSNRERSNKADISPHPPQSPETAE